MSKILYDDKVKLRDSELAEINKWTAENANSLKNGINDIDDRVIALETGTSNIIDVSSIWTSGLSFDVTANSFPILDSYYSASSALVTLVASDATFGRFDFIVAHVPVLPATVGTVGKLTGTPSANPADPDDFDPSTMYLIKRILIPALATEPQTETGGAIGTEVVYANGTGESAEWTFSSNSASIVNTGGVIDATNPVYGSKATMTNDDDVAGLDSNKDFSLSFDITLKANMEGSYIFIKLLNETGHSMINSLLLNNGDYGFKSNITTAQTIIINGSDFSFTTLGSFRQIQIYPFKSFAGYTLDNIKFHIGSAVIPQPSTHTHSNLDFLETLDQAKFDDYELLSNKKTDIEANKTSDTFVASVKAIYNWGVGMFQEILVSGINIKTINSTSILGSGDISISSQYTINQTPNNGAYNLLIGIVDGINSIFTVSDGSYLTGALSVYIDGQLMTQGVANDYTETDPATGTFTFVTAPPIGSIITATYISDPSIVGLTVTGWKTNAIENITLLTANWNLISGFYEYDYANAAILVDSVIEIIPYNSTIEIVRQAEILPMVVSGVGTVKLYAKNLPTNDILIALNIQK